MIVERLGVRRPRVTLTPGRKPVGPVTADVTHDLLLDSIAWYPLLGRTSKDVPDLLFRKEHGNLVGGVEYVRDYLEFDGSTGYVDFGNSDILTGATEVSFLTRVRFHTLTTNANIYRKNAAGQNSFAFGLDNINSDELTFGVIDPSNNWLIADTTDVNLTTGVWYDIAFVWEGGNNSFIIVNGTDATISNQLADNPSAIKGSTERNTFGCKYNAGAPDSFCHMDMAFSLVSTKALTKEHALRFFANPYAALASAYRPLIFSGAGGGTSVALSGTLSSGSFGSILSLRNVPLVGESAPNTTGTITPSRTIALIGEGHTVSTGTLTPLEEVLVALTGQLVSVSGGTLIPERAAAIVGSEYNTATGTLTPVGEVLAALTGQLVTTASGTLVPSRSVILAGEEHTVATGTLTPLEEVFIALVGQLVSSAEGSVSSSRLASLSGAASSVSAGTIVPDRTAALTGDELATAIGTLLREYSAGLTGEAITTTIGTVTISRTVDLSTFLASVSAGTITAVGGESLDSIHGKSTRKVHVISPEASTLYTITQTEYTVVVTPSKRILM